MALVLRDRNDVLNQLTTELRKSGITFLSKGGVARAISETVASEVESFYRFFDLNYKQCFLSSATDSSLEAIGSLFGVRRLQSRKSFATKASQSIMFYVDSGDFGDINGGSDITVPSGTLISTSSTQGLTSIQYQIAEDTLLDADASVAFAPVESLLEGSSSNVGPNVLTVHDYTGYISSALEGLKVTNRYALINGTDIENDQKLRFRISIAATALQRANLFALQFAALSVPGLVDLQLIRYYDGIGTVGVFIAGQDNETPSSLIGACQLAVNQYASAGELVTVYEPTKFGIQLVTQVNLSVPWTINIEKEIKESLLDRAFKFFAQQGIGQSFSIDDLRTVLVNSDSRISSLGKTPSTKPFDQLYVWKTSDVGGTRVRSEVLYPYTVITDALGNSFNGLSASQENLYIAEGSVTEPFVFEFTAI